MVLRVRLHLEDSGCFQHFGHEGGDPPHLAVPCAHPCKNAVPHRDGGLVAWDKASHLGHQHNHTNLHRSQSAPQFTHELYILEVLELGICQFIAVQFIL